jgi:hypothetical protein
VGCSSCGGRKSTQQEGPFIVTSSRGETVEVKDEFAARVQVAKWGGGSYEKKKT